ncbi:MAG: nucleotide sugar dehydrogenase [Chloroflexi bacterium]|nr:nucleotide sugar dehydrogenase [Chloroflexota bacterium]
MTARSHEQALLQKLSTRQARVAVVGLGYVGLPLATEIAQGGFTVTGIEMQASRVDSVNRGESYIPDVLTEDLRHLVEGHKVRAQLGYEVLAHTDVMVVAVPTPLDRNRNPDIQYIRNVVQLSLPYVHAGQLIIMESTSYPGTLEEAVLPGIEGKGLQVGKDVFVAYSSERIDPGNAASRLRNSPKVVGGVTPACTRVACAFYEAAISAHTHPVSSPRVAEMSKLLENTFRVVNVSLVNELSQLCDRMGVDIWEVINAASTKPFGFMSFYPGPGVGGHCIPIDPFYLSWKAKEYGFTTRFIELAGEINEDMPGYVVSQAMEQLNSVGKALKGSNVLVLGLAYKRDISDTRESAALKVVELLLERGARVAYHDPHVPTIEIASRYLESVALTRETLQSTDLAIVTTDHTAVDYRLVAAHAPLVYDTRNALKDVQGSNLRRLGAPSAPGH